MSLSTPSTQKKYSVAAFQKPFWQRAIPSLAVAAMGVFFTLLLTFRFLHIEKINLESEFSRQSRELTLTIQSAIEKHLEPLDATTAFLSSAPSLDASVFKNFSAKLLSDHPSLLALEWIPRIKANERIDFEIRRHFEGRKGFQILEIDQTQKLSTAKNHNEYYPSSYVEPWTGNEKISGLNHGQDPQKRAVMDLARDTGKAAATPVLRLTQLSDQNPHRQYGVMVFMPVYRSNVLPAKIEERRQRLMGFTAATFRVESILDRALQGHESDGIMLQTFARTLESHSDLVDIYQPKNFRSLPAPAAQKTIFPGFTLKQQGKIHIAGQEWDILTTSTRSFIDRYRRWEPQAVLAIGLLLSLLAAAYLALMQERQYRALTLALSLTDELTGLYNRRGFLALAEEHMKVARRNRRGFLFVMADLDYLKNINDRFGHAEGDWAIMQISSFLKSFFRNSDLVGRLGGDEFAAVLVGATPESKAHVSVTLKKNLQTFLENLKAPYPLGLSFGSIYFDPESPVTLTEIMDLADQELCDIKRNRTAPASAANPSSVDSKKTEPAFQPA